GGSACTAATSRSTTRGTSCRVHLVSDENVTQAEPAAVSLRETYRRQMIDSIGGWQGTVIAAVPTVVFVVVNATNGLNPAIGAAVGSALLLAIYRLVRRQSVQQ